MFGTHAQSSVLLFFKIHKILFFPLLPLFRLSEIGIAAAIVLIAKLGQRRGFHSRFITIHYAIAPLKPLFDNTSLNNFNKEKKGKIFKYLPTVGLGVTLIFKISGRGIIDPDAPIPLDTLTFVPSSRYLVPILQGFLHK